MTRRLCRDENVKVQKREKESIRSEERKREGNGKQVRTALTESNGGHMEKLICDSSEKIQRGSENVFSEHYTITLAEPANVSLAGGHKKCTTKKICKEISGLKE